MASVAKKELTWSAVFSSCDYAFCGSRYRFRVGKCLSSPSSKGSSWPEAKNFKSISWGGGSMLLVELLRLCLVSASVPGAAPETWKDRRIQSHRKPQTGPLIECMRNGRTFISVGELKVKGQKDEQELVIQEALASQLDLWKKNSDCWISEEIDSYSFSMRKMLWLGKVRSLLRWAFSSRKKRN